MLKEKYLKQIKQKVNNSFGDKNLKVFVFGSGLNKNHFGDIDLGLIGRVKQNDIYKLKEEFEESNLPYSVDVVNFNQVSDEFKKNVMKSKILWIKH